jgi:hypothetical protein
MVLIVEGTLTLLAEFPCYLFSPFEDDIDAIQFLLNAFGVKTVLRLLDQFSDVDVTAILGLEGLNHFLGLQTPGFSSVHEALEHFIGNKMLGEAFGMSLTQNLISSFLTLQGLDLECYKVIHGSKDILKIL